MPPEDGLGLALASAERFGRGSSVRDAAGAFLVCGEFGGERTLRLVADTYGAASSSLGD